MIHKMQITHVKFMLTQTARNFGVLLKKMVKKQCNAVLFPLSKAIKNNNPQDVEKYLKSLSAQNALDAEAALNLAAKMGHLPCVQTICDFYENHYKTPILASSALLTAVENMHNACALYLLPLANGQWRDPSFVFALQNNNHEFLKGFVRIVPISPRWETYVEGLARYDKIDVLWEERRHQIDEICAVLPAKWGSTLQQYFAERESQEQKHTLNHQIEGATSLAQSKRKI